MKSLWNAREARRAKDKLDLLVYRSRLIGSEPKLCVWGGGNTSTKTVERDHRGKMCRVLRIKGSGSDLKVSERKDYPPVALDELLDVFRLERMTDEAMVDYVSKCLLEPKAPRPSIEVLLHAFVDQPDIDHTHADAILSVTNTRHGRELAKKIFGDELIWIPYVKPGFTLAKRVGQAARENPEAKGAVLEKHGLITWGPDAKTSYTRTIQMVSRAEQFLGAAKKRRKHWSPPQYRTLNPSERRKWLLRFLPAVRSVLGRGERVILHYRETPEVMAFVNARDAARVSQRGPATPDHMLRTKRTPLYLRLPEGRPFRLTEKSLERQIEQYAGAHERYFKKYRHLLPADGTARLLNPYPKVILIPGVGMITAGKDLKSAKIVSEIYEHSISVMTAASRIGEYESLSEPLAFEMDYWPMELYKLSLAPPEAEFSRQVGLVTGAARGIGRAIAEHLARFGAHVFVADLDEKAVEAAARAINAKLRAERVFPLAMNVADAGSVRRGYEKIVMRCGGLDFLVSNAGIAHVAPIDRLLLQDWEKSLAVNATGHFLVAKGALPILKRQKMGGALVFIASKNVLAPGKDFGAYSAAKAAETQLARILAIENGEEKIRVNLINPDGVFDDSGLWQRIGKSRARSYGISPARLKDYYVKRNLMKTAVSPSDVAEAAAFLLSSRAAKTTGCILTVDGGVKEAFPR